MSVGLAFLALRRALAPVAVLAWAVLLAVALRFDWAGGSAALEATAGSADEALLARGLLRGGAWVVAAIALLPLAVVRAARIVPGWRSGEGDWIGSRAIGRGKVAVSALAGTFAGAAALLAATFAAIEIAAGAPTASFARAGSIPLPSGAWIEADAPLELAVADSAAVPAGARARVQLAFGSVAGSASEVVLRARRGSEERTSRARLASRGAVEVEIPPGSLELRLAIECPRPGARVRAEAGEIELWVPCASDRSAGLGILLRLLAVALASIGLALGLGAWTSASSAALAVLAAFAAAWLADSPPRWLPGADLGAALDVVGSGRVPAAPEPAALAASAGIAALGLALAVLGTRRWRAAP